jgi:hypothetical protein
MSQSSACVKTESTANALITSNGHAEMMESTYRSARAVSAANAPVGTMLIKLLHKCLHSTLDCVREIGRAATNVCSACLSGL